MCEFCQNHEQGDTLYEPSDWDGGIGFDYIRDIKYCPLCGKKLNSEDESTISKMEQVEDEPQTCEECEHWNDTEDGCADRHGCKDEPQTEVTISAEEYAGAVEIGNKQRQRLGKLELFDENGNYIEPQTDCPWK